MTRNRLWALGIPDLHPQAFQPRLGGGMRLFIGADAGDSQNVGESIYGGSPSYYGGDQGTGGDPVKAALYGDVGYGQGLTGAQTAAFDNVFAATGDVGRALAAMDTAGSAVAFSGS